MARVMIDTNIIYSAILYSSSATTRFFDALQGHELLITDYSLDEFRRTVNRKMPDKIYLVDYFIDNFQYTLIKTPTNFDNVPKMRDVKDTPILAAALDSDVDYLVTGDKDFFALEIDKPEILTMAEFVLRNEK